MNKETKNKKMVSKEKSPKKDMISFLYKTKNEAKKNKISYDMRLENYTNKNTTTYTYGIR